MATNYLHGVETIELKSGARTVQVVKTAVIGIVGIAPKGARNTPILVSSDREASEFGAKLSGFSLPQSLDAIFKQGAGTVIAVNVFDENKHTETLTETKKVKRGKVRLKYAPIGEVNISLQGGGVSGYIEGEDYTIDMFGNFQTVGTKIKEDEVLVFTYKRIDETKVTAGDIIGNQDELSENRTGLKCLDSAFNLFGFSPKIIIAPMFSDNDAVAKELIITAEKFRAITYLDAPFATTVQEAIEGRGPGGLINFNTSSNRAELLYPMLKYYNPHTDSEELFPYSAFMAGVRARVDNDEGFWVSSSNHEIKGITGIERPISAGISDANSEANQLNEKGITTVFNSFGTGLRTWGNRSASYPSNTSADNFVSVRRTADVIHESVELACLDFIDQPITQGWIDSVRETVNSFLRTLQGRGAILDGVCKYNPYNNPKTELANGHITFSIDFMPPTPAERISFESLINIEYLAKLK